MSAPQFHNIVALIKALERNQLEMQLEIAQLKAKVKRLTLALAHEDEQTLTPVIADKDSDVVVGKAETEAEAVSEAELLAFFSEEQAPVTTATKQQTEEVVVLSASTEAEKAETLDAQDKTQSQIKTPKPQPPVIETEPNALLAWLWRGNPLLKIGVVILFIGVAFLLRYASQFVVVPLEVRYALVFCAGAGLTVFAYVFLRPRQRDYALVVQGAGIAIGYLTILAAYKLHHLLSGGVAFVLLWLPLAAMVGLALLQNAQVLAQVALIGGLATPILSSSGSGDYVALFTYLAVLNTGFAWIAWFKRWKSLNFISFYGSLGIALLWASQADGLALPTYLSGFVVYHLLLYSVVAWRFAALAEGEQALTVVENDASLARLGEKLLDYIRAAGVIDQTLTLSTATWAFVLLALIWRGDNVGVSTSAIAVALGLYYLLVAVLARQLTPSLQILQRVFFYCAVIFITFAIPLYFSIEHTVSLWGVQAGLLYWLGVQTRNPYWRLTAMVLLGLATLGLLRQIQLPMNLDTLIDLPLLSWLCVFSGLALVVACAYKLSEKRAHWEMRSVYAAFSACLLLIVLLVFSRMQWLQGITLLMVLSLAGAWLLPRLRTYFAEILMVAIWGLWLVWTLWASVTWAIGFGYEGLGYVQSYFSWHGLPTVLVWLLSARIATQYEYQSQSVATYQRKLVPLLLCAAFVAAYVNALTLLTPDFQTLYRLLLPLLALVTLLWLVGMSLWRWRLAQTMTLSYLPVLLLLLYQRLSADINSYFYGLEMFYWSQAQGFNNIWQLLALALLALVQYRCLALYQGRFALRWQQLGFNALALGALWSLWHVTYNAVGADLGWTIWLYLYPLVLLLFYVASTWRERLLGAATTWLETALLWSILVGSYLVLLFMPPTSSALFLLLINPVGMVGVTILALLYYYQRRGIWHWRDLNHDTIQLCVLAIWGLGNVEWLRLWVVYAKLPWSVSALWQSTLVQTSFSLLWTLQGIVLMVWANRRSQRQLWLTGASLLAVVVLKLFVVDLSQTNSIERIVSFMGVGALLMVVGYVAPIPPDKA